VSDCPPPPVELAVSVEGEPSVELPLSTAQWYAARDVYAVRVDACLHDANAALLMAEAERDAALWLADQRAAEVEALRMRPRWGTVAGAAGLGVVVGGLGAAWLLVR
jgi:hypothetical protein